MKDDLRSEAINDGNDMPELIKVVDVDKADRMCWKMKFVKGVNVNLEGNDVWRGVGLHVRVHVSIGRIMRFM